VLENWSKDDGTALESWEKDTIEKSKQYECIQAISKLIKIIKPYVLIGFSNGISKPICPFL
jgi:hypothetical protein